MFGKVYHGFQQVPLVFLQNYYKYLYYYIIISLVIKNPSTCIWSKGGGKGDGHCHCHHCQGPEKNKEPLHSHLKQGRVVDVVVVIVVVAIIVVIVAITVIVIAHKRREGCG